MQNEMSITSISKTINSIKVQPQIKNNNYVKPKNVSQQLQFIITFESLLGINRLRLINIKKCGLIISGIFSVLLLSFCLFFTIRPQTELRGSHLIVKYTNIVELTLLVFSSSFVQTKTLVDLFRNLYEVDKTLSISGNDRLTPTASGVRWLVISCIYCITEYVFFVVRTGSEFDPVHIAMYIALSAHNFEQIFFGTLLRAVNMRLLVLKEHVIKVLRVDDHPGGIKKTISPAERLAGDRDLDVSELHKLYEKLHTCSENLNSVMGFPMLVMLVSSGVTTTLLAMTIINLFQTHEMDELMAIYCVVRCTIYTGLVVVPCYYCSITQEQVQIIRTVLHDAINIGELDRQSEWLQPNFLKELFQNEFSEVMELLCSRMVLLMTTKESSERRKVKAFLQLARDNEFSYALWGIINMNMSLPLSYLSICTTYLVIIIQFSKFLD